MLDYCLIIILSFIGIITCGLFIQKNFFIKLLFLNSLTSIISLFICFLGSYKTNSSYLDIALIYFILSFLANLAYLRYFLNYKIE